MNKISDIVGLRQMRQVEEVEEVEEYEEMDYLQLVQQPVVYDRRADNMVVLNPFSAPSSSISQRCTL
jgi:hypothetical protein